MELRAGYRHTSVGVIPGDWSVVKTKELVEIMKSGLSRRLHNEDIGIPVITSSNIQNTRLATKELKYWYLEDPQGANTSEYFIRDGDILLCFINSLAQIGKPCIFRDFGRPAIYTTNIFRIVTSKKYVSELFYYLLCADRLQNEIQLIVKPAVNQASFTKFDFLNIQVAVPSDLKEQLSITRTLVDVDALLDSLDLIISKKRDLKQAAMQQLLTGRRRLPGFGGEWYFKSLGLSGKCLRGVSYQGDSDLSMCDTSLTKRLLRSNNVQGAMINNHDVQFVNAAKVAAHQILKKNDILICMANGSKALVGKAGLFNLDDGNEYTFGAFMGCFRTNHIEANPKFIFYLFQTGRYRDFINNLLAGSSINNLRPSSIESLEFIMPPIPEQDAIAETLSDMDLELANLEVRREKIALLKKGMMQELLTGKTRLI
jgi:type I restriction enzyme S subunit